VAEAAADGNEKMRSDWNGRVYWIGSSDGTLADQFQAQVILGQSALENFALGPPAIFVVDLRSSTTTLDLGRIRTQLGHGHVMIAVVDELSEANVSTLYSMDADDVIDGTGACLPESVLARAASRLHLRGQAERARNNAYAMQAALEGLPVPMFYKNTKGVYLGCNTAFERYIGLERSRIIGHTVYDVAPTALAEIYERADSALLETSGVQTYETRVRYADGEEHDVVFYKSVSRDSAGMPLGLAGAMLDITERKKLQAELRRWAEQDALTPPANMLMKRSGARTFRCTVPRRRGATASTSRLKGNREHWIKGAGLQVI
jgi:PAS domain S-box-containing protein